MHEAKRLAEEEAPSIFALVSLLENEDEINRAILRTDVSFTFASELVPEHVKKHEELKSVDKTDRLFNAMNITKTTTTRDKEPNIDHLEIKRKLDTEKTAENVRIRKRVNERLEVPKLMKERQKLPAWNERHHIMTEINCNQVVVISGMTGCGKSTQVPQFILDNWLSDPNGDKKHCSIVCTQPRRISAIGVAERVAAERYVN